MNDVVESIRGKLSRGEELQPEDLRLLQPLHDIGEPMTSTTTTAAAGGGGGGVPYLNRSLLNNDTAIGVGTGPQLVRYVGMVQDMLDPEYYVTKDNQGRSMHFHDDGVCFVEDSCPEQSTIRNSGNVTVVHADDHRSNHLQNLAERTPLVIVPIPFASEWFRHGFQQPLDGIRKNNCDTIVAANSPKSVTQQQQQPLDPPRKRGREGPVADDDQMTDSGENEQHENITTKQIKPTDDDRVMPDSEVFATKSISNQDWWPAGTCGTSRDDCPILAKFPYDQLLPPLSEELGSENNQEPSSPLQQRLLLNDVVSVVGVLSMNPWEADFSKQHSQQPSNNNSIDEWMSSGWGGDAFATALPPPSRLPRLHVLSYQRVQLDSLAHQITAKPHGIGEEVKDMEESDNIMLESSSNSYCPKSFARQFQCSQLGESTSSLALSLWMCLLSKADRRANDTARHKGMIHVGPMERALGCWSLQVSTPDVERSRAMFRHLAKDVLPHFCPVVATIDCTQKDDPIHLVTGPSKDSNGRLRPCPLQLPAGSVLLVHYHPVRTTDHSKMKAALQELVQHHRLSYRFEGGVVLPFEADYQIIVITTQTQQLPCTVSILSKDVASEVRMSLNDAAHLQRTLCRARNNIKHDGSKSEFTLSSSLLERAQKDFLERRRQAYESQQEEETPTQLPGEDDFHRWLNTTKLLAKSRISLDHNETSKWEATVKDWETALDRDNE
ncbi:mini-chromosome maintenance replisome factor [Nitzschia inconspicua]|uniref:Mini-chromosome maintenance replisome factor n=1 Tax=Nitzschia inconspicua TaxID=303405 RepID=A0A9K3L998_9STRA|nr:mini-chromosome maintenance replisome factor [Nitzschia inconspicua]